jgi:hypothetical protein
MLKERHYFASGISTSSSFSIHKKTILQMTCPTGIDCAQKRNLEKEIILLYFIKL